MNDLIVKKRERIRKYFVIDEFHLVFQYNEDDNTKYSKENEHARNERK